MLYCCTCTCVRQRCINFISIGMRIWYIDVDWGELVTRSEGRDQSGFFFNLKFLNLAANMHVIPSQPALW